jgi:hypothetical protein
MSAQCNGSQKLLRIKIQYARVLRNACRLPQEEENTIRFYSDFAISLVRAEVRPDSELTKKETAMNEYNSIAFNYEDQGDYATASYFYKKVI